MNNMKKLASLLLALVMVLAMAAPAMADGETETPTTTYTITINNSASGHTYEAYQIFTGTLGANGELGNIQWGANVSAAGQTALGGAAAKAESLTDANVKAFADEVAQYLTTTTFTTNTVVDGKYTISGLDAGYYLVKDMDGSLTEADDAYTSYILKVIKNETVTPKSVKPTVDKQVWDEATDDDKETDENWGETADHAINESFQFKLIANLPGSEHYADYETYKVIFNDTMSDGVTFESIASVKVDGVTLTESQYNCTAAANQAGGSWTLTINDVKTIVGVNLVDGAVIEVIYNAHLNEDAVIGNFDDNLNKVYLQYSNNPNASGSGEDDEEFGKTPDDTVWVFTYEVLNTKVDGDNQPLAGAGFNLYQADGTTEVKLFYDADKGVYRPVAEGETAVERMISTIATEGGKAVFNIVGLDVGTYVLKETLTPAGYNTCADITFTITAEHKELTDDTAETIIKIDDDVNKKGFDVVNESGAELPETGGMGTTVIYVIGCLLVAGAAIMLFAKKRAGK